MRRARRRRRRAVSPPQGLRPTVLAPAGGNAITPSLRRPTSTAAGDGGPRACAAASQAVRAPVEPPPAGRRRRARRPGHLRAGAAFVELELRVSERSIAPNAAATMHRPSAPCDTTRLHGGASRQRGPVAHGAVHRSGSGRAPSSMMNDAGSAFQRAQPVSMTSLFSLPSQVCNSISRRSSRTTASVVMCRGPSTHASVLPRASWATPRPSRSLRVLLQRCSSPAPPLVSRRGPSARTHPKCPGCGPPR